MTILVVAKLPDRGRYAETDLARLERAGVPRRRQLEEAETRHQRALDQVVTALRDHPHRVITIPDLAQRQPDFDLLVTVGGDGTVLAAQALVGDQPVLAVNSDPERSIGHFTRCHGEAFATLLADWQSGTAAIEQHHRLQVVIEHGAGAGVEPLRFLNDCLITNANPAVMSRYLIECGGIEEEQYSSGLWVSTASGATGGIASAGMVAQVGIQPTLLFKVREPFQRRGPYQLLDGVQQPPRRLRVTPTVPGMAAYIDGGHDHPGHLPAGTVVRIEAAPQPLQLVAPAG